MAVNPFKKPSAAGTVKVAGSKGMTNKQVKGAGTSGFSFKGSGQKPAYVHAAKQALKGGATAAQAHKAGSVAQSNASGSA